MKQITTLILILVLSTFLLSVKAQRPILNYDPLTKQATISYTDSTISYSATFQSIYEDVDSIAMEAQEMYDGWTRFQIDRFSDYLLYKKAELKKIKSLATTQKDQNIANDINAAIDSLVAGSEINMTKNRAIKALEFLLIRTDKRLINKN